MAARRPIIRVLLIIIGVLALVVVALGLWVVRLARAVPEYYHPMPASSENAAARPVIIVVQLQTPTGPITTGVLVDQVLEVRNIASAHIEPPPSFGRDDEATRFILGIAKAEKRVILLIDIDLILASTNLSLVA